MIKAIAVRKDDGAPFVVFGLSRQNIEHLQAGEPIHIDMAELGLRGTVLIIASETEASMARDLADLIGPDTEVRGKENLD